MEQLLRQKNKYLIAALVTAQKPLNLSFVGVPSTPHLRDKEKVIMALVKRRRTQINEEEARPNYLDLVPALFVPGQLNEFVESGQTVQFTVSPRSNSLAVYVSPSGFRGGDTGDHLLESDIYIAALNYPPTGRRRVFVSDTFLVFRACYKYAKANSKAEANGVRTVKDVTVSRKIANDYILHVQDSWINAMKSSSSNDEPPRYTGDHYRCLYSTFSLFKVLYLPEDGVEDVPVGDELLEWLNTHSIEPSTEEGDRLSNLQRPWEDDFFWPYLLRATLRGLTRSSIFFLRHLAKHPSERVQLLSGKTMAILNKHPRQRNFVTEREFSTAFRRWREKVKALRIELDRVPENDRRDGFENWWENISDLLSILEGREDVLERLCTDFGGNWKEMICIYGIWVDVGLRRSELPDIIDSILLDMPADPTDKEDALHLELVKGRPAQALAIAHSMDPWLPAHLVDIMACIGLLGSDVDDETGMSIRDYYVLSYAEYLHSDPGLWRLTVDYLYTCSEIGMEMADEILMRVPLEFNDGQKLISDRHEDNYTALMEVEEDLRDQSSNLSAIIAARKLAKLKKYGLAVSFCRSAEDWTLLGHIIETVMEEYITQGPAHYVSLVADIAPSLPELRVEPGPQGIFVQRLKFAVRYAEFHQRKMDNDLENALLDLVSIFVEDLAPRAWWGVLLYDAIAFLEDEQELAISSSDACLLLRRLEEVVLRTSQGCGNDYLGILARVLKSDGTKEAFARLDDLRLALARYLARCNLPGPASADGPSTYENEVPA
ncbi:hypothetical protein A7U60_g6522 [Sanghuangporus baumii]|uniref:Nuclear pore complex protein Nup85 n=1 Tax=Sanghuangporus baumii TaxID=108892 RepID=A0A9Q5NAH0_SANBA|nr:hypothetical protein A7U60_g6522 [Sanghuangporus baumii]